jgi:cold shock protein
MAPTFTGDDTTIGRVKWFNNKAGYGFITSSSGDDEKDIFVHHSSIMVAKNQYKYLVTGEYVSFNVEDVENNEKYNCQAKNVKGVGGGPLMCETRNEQSQSQSHVEGKGSGPPGDRVNLGKQWMLVQRRPQNRGAKDNKQN